MLKECHASSGRFWASSLIKRLRVTTGRPSRQTRSRKTRALRHAGGYKETDRSSVVAVVKFMTAGVMYWCAIMTKSHTMSWCPVQACQIRSVGRARPHCCSRLLSVYPRRLIALLDRTSGEHGIKTNAPKPQRCAIYTRKSPSTISISPSTRSIPSEKPARPISRARRTKAGCSSPRFDDVGLSGASLEGPALQAVLSAA